MLQNKRADGFYKRMSVLALLVFSVFALYRGFCAAVIYDEIDSNVMPLESMQYRGTLFVNESDIAHAREDFPEQYAGIETYDELHSAKLIKATEEKWISYYFPAYPFLCLPLKYLFQWLGMAQTKAFTVTNALMLIASLWVCWKYLSCSERGKFFALVGLMCSPAIYYISYLNYEIYMCSWVIVSISMHCSGHRRLGALCLALAGVSNLAIMSVGFLYIAEYFVDLFREECGQKMTVIIRKRFCPTVVYGAMYLPCLVPFVFQRIVLGANFYQINTSSAIDYGARVLSYWFDPTVGLFVFAPLMILLLFLGTIAALFAREWRMAARIFYPIAAICTVSLMFHINCGMIACARYLIWIYPLVVIPTAFFVQKIQKERVALLLSCTVLASSAGLILWNHPKKRCWLEFNNSTAYLIHAAPGSYNPYYALFYCRNEQDWTGGYWDTYPSYFEDELDEGCVRKILYRADEGAAFEVMEGLRGDEESLAWVAERLEQSEDDGQFHYINIPRRSHCRVWVSESISEGKE